MEMSDLQQSKTGYIGYEYRQITIPKEQYSLCMDSYPCFGWEHDPNKKTEQSFPSVLSGKRDMVSIHFRRNRNISNKAELTRLQRNFDSCIGELKALEQAKTSMPGMVAVAIALLGTAFMAGATFAAVAEPPVIWLMILLSIPGFLAWILPYFIYRALVRKKTAEIEPLMEQKYEEIYSICEKGNNLLH